MSSIDLDPIRHMHAGTLADWLGVRFVEASASKVTLELDMRPELSTFGGGTHAGILMAFADIAGALGAYLNLAPGLKTSTFESKQNFVGSIREGTLRAIAEPLHLGSRTMVWQTKVFDAQNGRLLANVIQTQMTIPK